MDQLSPTHIIVITVILAWTAVMIAGSWQANQKELMKHRERLAMIDKGVPMPEAPTVLPAAPMQALMGTTSADTQAEKERQMLDFIRFLGILTIGAGIAIWFLLVVLDQWNGAVGIGGMMVILGVALIATTMRALRIRRDGD